jgi:hypothetical protein
VIILLDRILSYSGIILSITPAIIIFCTFTAAVRAYKYLGYWPTYAHPDPQFLPDYFETNFAVGHIFFVIFLYSFLAFPLLCLLKISICKSKMNRKIFWNYWIGFVSINILMCGLWNNFVAWFFD